MLCKERHGKPDCVECDNMDPEAECPGTCAGSEASGGVAKEGA